MRAEVSNTSDDFFPSISVVMAVKDEERYIAKCLQGFENQTYAHDRFEVVIASGSSDSTDEIIREFIEHGIIRIKHLNNPSTRTADGLNLAIAAASAEYISFFIGHSFPDMDYLRVIVETLKKTDVQITAGRVFPVPYDGSLILSAIACALGHPFSVGKNAFNINKAVYRSMSHWVTLSKSRALEAGPLKHYKRGEDYEYIERLTAAGCKCFYNPQIKCYYYPRENYWKLFKQYSVSGYYRYLLHAETGGCMTIWHLAPPLMVFVLLMAMVSASFWSVVPLIAILLPYLALNAYSSFKASRGKSLRLIPFIFISNSVIHFAYGGGFLVSMIYINLVKIVERLVTV